MKICLAQIHSQKGNIQKNIELHLKWIDQAVAEKADIIAFPELSLTGYDPQLAKDLACRLDDERLNIFQEISDANNLVIAAGLPIASESGIFIGMVIFQAHQSRTLYSKQKLHEDEKPFFIEGRQQVFIKIQNSNIAPAICYEALQSDHAENAVKKGADVYLASVAKPQRGIDKAYEHFPKIAKQYSIPVLMVNCIGFCDNFQSAGQSAIWSSEGKLWAQLSENEESLLAIEL